MNETFGTYLGNVLVNSRFSRLVVLEEGLVAVEVRRQGEERDRDREKGEKKHEHHEEADDKEADDKEEGDDIEVIGADEWLLRTDLHAKLAWDLQISVDRKLPNWDSVQVLWDYLSTAVGILAAQPMFTPLRRLESPTSPEWVRLRRDMRVRSGEVRVRMNGDGDVDLRRCVRACKSKYWAKGLRELGMKDKGKAKDDGEDDGEGKGDQDGDDDNDGEVKEEEMGGEGERDLEGGDDAGDRGDGDGDNDASEKRIYKPDGGGTGDEHHRGHADEGGGGGGNQYAETDVDIHATSKSKNLLPFSYTQADTPRPVDQWRRRTHSNPLLLSPTLPKAQPLDSKPLVPQKADDLVKLGEEAPNSEEVDFQLIRRVLASQGVKVVLISPARMSRLVDCVEVGVTVAVGVDVRAGKGKLEGKQEVLEKVGKMAGEKPVWGKQEIKEKLEEKGWHRKRGGVAAAKLSEGERGVLPRAV